MPSLQTYRQLPEIVSGYPLDDVWSVVVPIARTNLVTNPSFETNTTSWTAIGGSIARSTTQQYHGAYSLAITPTATTTDGARFDTVSLTSGTTYAYSAKVRGVAGLNYLIAIETTGGVALATVTFRATGRWQWITGYYTETSTTTRRFTARKSGHASVAIFYLDGVQVEAIATGETVSTYIDGDQLGLVPNQNPPAYVWNGTPHASSSTRSGLTRAGGMVVPFRKYGFILTAIIGLGLANVTNVATEYARLDGGYDDYTRKPTRQFTLAGRFQGRTYAELRRNRGALADLFDRDLIAQDQRLTLLRHVEDRNGNIITSEARIFAKYASGLSGNTDNMHAENAPITFTQYLPNVLSDGESGASLSVQLSVANANAILRRSPAGVWSVMGSGSNGLAVLSLQIGLDGKVYAGGLFTAMGGVANTNHVAYWDTTTGVWNAMGTGMAAGANGVYNFAVGPDGSIYAVGDFTLAGGVANTARLAKWNGSAWSSITPAGSANGSVFAAAFDRNGNLYVTGGFTTINGVAANRIAKMDTAGTWTALSTGLNSNGLAIVVDAANNVYVGGGFTTPFANITKWNGSAFSALGAGLDDVVRALIIGANGVIYAGGDFLNSGSVSVTRIAAFNGVAWSSLGSGLTGGVVTSLAYNPTTGQLFIGGTFTTANGRTLPDSLAIWTGADYVFADIDLPGGAQVYAIKFAIDGTMYVGFDQLGTATAGSTTTITNPGTARSYPVVTIKGPSSGTASIWSILNTTTGRSLFFNYVINAGETAILVLQPDNLSFTSDFQGNIAGKIQPGSNTADFFLQPGANIIAFLSGSSTVTATVNWRPAYASIDDIN